MSSKKKPSLSEPKDSDLVKLTREFERLRAQLASLDSQAKACDERDTTASAKVSEAQKVANQVHVDSRGEKEMLAKARRIADTQFQVVKELLEKQTGSQKECLWDGRSIMDIMMKQYEVPESFFIHGKIT